MVVNKDIYIRRITITELTLLNKPANFHWFETRISYENRIRINTN